MLLALASAFITTYADTLFITDAAINIFLDLDAKRDIIQNAIDLYTQVGLAPIRALLERRPDLPQVACFDKACNAICPGSVPTPLVQKQIEDRAAREKIRVDHAKTSS